jgi:hypothetical protein
MSVSRQERGAPEDVLDEIFGDLDANPFAVSEQVEENEFQAEEIFQEEGEALGDTEFPESDTGEHLQEGEPEQGGSGSAPLPLPGGEGSDQAEALMAALMDSVSDDGPITLDLGGGDELSAESLAVLVSFARDFTEGRGLRLTGAGEKFQVFFEACNLERDTGLSLAGQE